MHVDNVSMYRFLKINEQKTPPHYQKKISDKFRKIDEEQKG